MVRRGGGNWRAPGVVTKTCIEGGYLKQPHVLPTETFPGDDGRDILCVQVGKSEGWLAEAVTGKHVSARSMNRTNVFEEMREKFAEKRQFIGTCGSGGDIMADLGYEDDSAAECSTPSRKRRQNGPASALELALATTPEKGALTPKAIQMQLTASVVSETVDVKVVVRKRGLFLDVLALPWLFEYLRREMTDGPVIEEDSEDDQDAGRACVYWDFHNDCWLARKKTADGQFIVKRGPVERRMRTVGDALHGLTRDQAKRAVHDELREWHSDSVATPGVFMAPAAAAFTSV